MFMSRSLVRFERAAHGHPQPNGRGRIIGDAISVSTGLVDNRSLALLLSHMSFASLSDRCIRQTGLGQHAGGWSAPVNPAVAPDSGRFNPTQAVMPRYRQPGRISGAGTEHGGRTP